MLFKRKKLQTSSKNIFCLHYVALFVFITLNIPSLAYLANILRLSDIFTEVSGNFLVTGPQGKKPIDLADIFCS